MKSTALKRVGVLAVATILLGVLVYTSSDRNEPRHQGVKVTVWLRDYNVASEIVSSNARPEAEEAIREIGPSAVPYIICKLKTDDSDLKRNYRATFPKLPR